MIQLMPGINNFKEIKVMISRKFLNVAVKSTIVLILFLLANGCKSDIAQPIWEQPFTTPPTPKINGVVPAEAIAGVNTITINGENFASASGTNTVYFNTTQAEVISSSSTSIVVRRPNVVSDSAEVKVVSSQALQIVKYYPYKVDRVFEEYGNFDPSKALSVLVADNQDNLYVIEERTVYKVTPDGEKTVIATANRISYDAKIGPDGNLYLTGNNRAVDKVDLTTGTVTRWVQLPSGKTVKYGDFDDNGNFYSGGIKTDLIVVGSNATVKPALGYYTTYTILAVKAYNNYLYVAAKKSDYADTTIIFRHSIDAAGNLGAQETVLDMRTSSDLAARTVTGITFSTSGVMYIATDAVDPIVTFNPVDSKLDYLYKGILRPYCKSFCWGPGTYIYMLNGDAATGEKWAVHKVNTGITGNQ